MSKPLALHPTEPDTLMQSNMLVDMNVKVLLNLIRAGIARYRAENGEYPGQAGSQAAFKADVLDRYINGTFPKCPVAGQNANVKISFGTSPIGGDDSIESWHYAPVIGMFIVNSTAATLDDPLVTYDQL